MLGPSFCGKHAQDACTAAHIQHDFSLEEMWIINDGGAVRSSADGILQHLFMDACMSAPGQKKKSLFGMNGRSPRTKMSIRVGITVE
jgi:hypothetical protein